MSLKSVSKQPSTVAAIALALSALALAPMPARAMVLQTSAAGDVGNQTYSGVGVEFSVNSPITVTSLGAFDSGLSGSIATDATLTVDLMTFGGGIIASQTFTSGAPGSLSGNYLFKDISAVILGAGANYFLMGYGWTADQQEHNKNVSGSAEVFTSSPLVSYVSAPWGDGGDAPGTLPDHDVGDGSVNYFEGPNMQFDAVGSTPLPSTWTMLIAGFAGLGFFAYRGSKNNAAVFAAA
jgi:hypothetical protein